MIQMPNEVTTKLGKIPQSHPVSPNQVQNNAGGFVFQITPEQQLDRFLILGSTGSYYQSGAKMNLDNCQVIVEMVKDNHMGRYAVSRALGHSITGRASNNDYCLAVLALALTHGTRIVKKDAEEALPQVARIGTHILHFAQMANDLRGWGRQLKRAMSKWYTEKPIGDLAYHLVKYANRDGYTQRDVLRLCHPKAKGEVEGQNDLFKYVVNGTLAPSLPKIVLASEFLKTTQTPEAAIKCIQEYNLPRECIPTQLLTNVKVWEALLAKMPLGALIRNLNKVTSLGILKPLSDVTKEIADKINNVENLKKARMHPIQLLFALKTYSSGHGDKGKLTWMPVPEIVASLEQAFYKSFDFVEPSGKKFLIGIDISGSMAGSVILNSNVNCRDASIAMALMTVKREPRTYAVAFDAEQPTAAPLGYRSYGLRNRTDAVRPIQDLTPELRMKDFHKVGGDWHGGATDCALPMLYALKENLEVEVFVIYTDNETYCGSIHPHVALKQYQQHSGIRAKLIVVGMTSTGFSIAEPGNPDMLDVVGFDPSTPAIISAFARGDL